MLQDELGWAVEEASKLSVSFDYTISSSYYGQNEPYQFTHYLVLSRIWRWTAEETQAAIEDIQPTNPPTKKRKQKRRMPAAAFPMVNSYHPEDECIQKVCPFLLSFSTK